MTLKPDPTGTPRHPLVVYLLSLALVSGVAQALGRTTARSVEDGLPPSVRLTWALILAGGSGLALAGMFWQGDPRTGLVLKRSGYLALASAAAIYSLVLLGTIGLAAALIGLTVAGFAAACAVAAWRIDRLIRLIVRVS